MYSQSGNGALKENMLSRDDNAAYHVDVHELNGAVRATLEVGSRDVEVKARSLTAMCCAAPG
jgi:hypothetical protein